MSHPFTLDAFLALPRLSDLALSPDGRRLVVAVSRPDAEGTKFLTSLWQVDPAGERPARRLTRSAVGESMGAFLPDGSLAFTSARPDPDVKPDPNARTAHPITALWLLPPDGGEAHVLVAPDGGLQGIATARSAGVVGFGAMLHPGSDGLAADAAHEKARRDAGVQAILFEDYPIRHWDAWLGPRHRRLFCATLSSVSDERVEPRDVTGDQSNAFVEAGIDLAPDGATLYATRRDFDATPVIREPVVAIDVTGGTVRQLTSGDAWYHEPKASPDGRWVVCLRERMAADEPADGTLWLIDLATGEERDLTPALDLWPASAVWLPDSSGVLFTADEHGHHPAFRVDLADGRVTRLTGSGALDCLCPAPDGRTVYALRSTPDSPPRIVRFAADIPDQQPEELASSVPEPPIDPPGVVERLTATADDGTPIESWLIRPRDASADRPAPLLVWAHGGPLGSWEGWHWRWNPNLLVERGYAVLLPDPALSTGYGRAMVARGWGGWGEAPYTDIMRAADAALARPELDATRTALMGGSYGGYMANWVAGHTDRFRAIVTHASLWELRGFHGTTDTGVFWEHEMGDPYREPERYLRQSPAEHLAAIRTPMLVVHGEQDFRVPLSEALRLWTDLRRHSVPARFLYFPDENHWVLKPQNARIWYETVFAFLGEYVLDESWTRPTLL